MVQKESQYYYAFYFLLSVNKIKCNKIDSSGSILARYIYAGGRHISKIAGSDTFYYHCDALGSPRRMINESGTLKWQARYYPFGEMSESGFEENTHGFTGKEFDEEMDLNYFCQRYYDPEIGRFMRLDPEDSPASSPYAYCHNNPLKFTDPTGTSTWWGRPQVLSGRYPTTGGAGKPPLERIPWNFSQDQWSWIEQMMLRHSPIDEDGRTRAALFFARSAQLDPDFWFRGWDWNCPNNDLTRQAMFLLSSGIFEWDVLTWSGWQHINIGGWLMANNLQLNIVFSGGGSVDFFIANNIMNIDPSIANNVFDLAALITHEGTHLLANRGGWLGNRRAEVKASKTGTVTGTRRQQEIWATSMMLDLFGDKLSPDFLDGVKNYLNLYRNAPMWPGW